MPKVQGGGAKLPQLRSTGIDGQQVSERERTVPQYCPPKHVSSSITSWKIDGETVETMADYFFGLQNSLQMVTAAMKLKDAYSLEQKL